MQRTNLYCGNLDIYYINLNTWQLSINRYVGWLRIHLCNEESWKDVGLCIDAVTLFYVY